MSTKTAAAVVAVLAAAIIGGGIIWAVSDDETTREAELRESALPPGSFSYRLGGLPQGAEYAVGSYAVGTTKPARSTTTSTTTTTTTDKYAALSEPLRFSRPLDAVSLLLFEEAARSRLHQQVTLELLRQGSEDSQPVPVLRYEFTSAVLGKGDEEAANGERSRQDVELAFKSMAIVVPNAGSLGYAPADGSIGYLRIPGVADEPEKSGTGTPAYVVSYSWGWENPNAAAIASGATTTGKFMANSLTIGRRLDSHAPWFWQQSVQGKSIPELELHLQPRATAEDSSPTVYATYKLTNALVVAVHDTGGEVPMQQIKLDFSAIELRIGQNVQMFTGGSRAG